MQALLRRGIVATLLAAALLLIGASPALAAVGAVRIQGADRYETSARTALTAY